MTRFQSLDYSTDENVRMVGNKAIEGKLIGLVLDNERKLDHFLEKLGEQFPDVKIVDRTPMAKQGPMKDSILVRIRGGTLQ